MGNSDKTSPAARIIGICGGIDKTAALIGRHRSVVNRWLLPAETGGTGGRVPTKHQQTLLDAARAAGLPLAPADFFAAAADPGSGPGPAVERAARLSTTKRSAA